MGERRVVARVRLPQVRPVGTHQLGIRRHRCSQAGCGHLVAVPIAGEARAIPQIFDADAASSEHARDRPRLGQVVEPAGRGVSGALEGSAQMRGPERDDITQGPDPVVARFGRDPAGTPRDETAHRVPDEHELRHGHGPYSHHLLEEVGQRAGVVRDAQTGVVAQIERGQPQVVAQQRAIGDRRVALVPHGTQ